MNLKGWEALDTWGREVNQMGERREQRLGERLRVGARLRRGGREGPWGHREGCK